MKFKSEVLTQASGSIGGVTYAHNVGGMYRRARSIPVNPNSAAQLAARTNFTDASIRWSQTLTVAQRDAWSAYAALTPTTDVFGDPLTLSGQQMYVRCNTVRLRGGASFVDAGPTNPGLIQLSAVGVSIKVGTDEMSYSFDNTDGWANDDDGGLVIQTSRFLSPAINFFRSPFRLLSTIDGNGTTAPTSPQDEGSSNAFGQLIADATVGQKCFSRVTAFAGDGRISASQTFEHILSSL